jgi:hypothetical protein
MHIINEGHIRRLKYKTPDEGTSGVLFLTVNHTRTATSGFFKAKQ